MKKKLGILLALTLGVILLFWYQKTGDLKPLSDTIIVGTSADFPPFSFRAQDDSITGFDIDVIKEVAKRLSMKIDIQDRPFGTLLPQIELGQIHAIAAGMTPTEERAKRVYFTKPYLSSNPLLIVTRATDSSITHLNDLKSKNIIVNTGYTADLYMSNIPDINLIRLGKVADALTALDNGKGDAFVTATFTLSPYVKEDDPRYKYFRIQETDEQSALALSKKLPKLFIDKIQSALDDMEADGTLEALKRKWNVI